MPGDSIVTPVIVDGRGDIQLFADVGSAERELECTDVLNGEYDLFDARGAVLIGICADVDSSVRIRLDPGGRVQRDELRSRLRSFVKALGSDRLDFPHACDAELDDLVVGCSRFFGVAD